MNFSEIEQKILEFWKEKNIFEKSLRKNKGKKNFVFFEGPPTANGRPGIHHVEARSFKDVILRYKTMRGFFVDRKAGWDMHGLPVELQVEKELGLKNKKEIEEYLEDRKISWTGFIFYSIYPEFSMVDGNYNLTEVGEWFKKWMREKRIK